MWALVFLTFLSFAITEGMKTDTQISTMDLDSLQPGTLGTEAFSLGQGVPCELSTYYCNVIFLKVIC
jgi:hypothetical protein